MKTMNLNKLMICTMAAFALTTGAALAGDTGSCPQIGPDAETIREVSSQSAHNAEKKEYKHRSLLNKEVREPRESSHY